MSSKRYKKLPENTKTLQANTIDKLLADIKKNCTSKFDESIDLSMQINNKQKKNEITIRTIVNMPSGTGKKVKVAVICEDTKIDSAKKAGAEVVPVDTGSRTLVDAVSECMRYYVSNCQTTHLAVGSAIGANVFLKICAWSTSQISRELKLQIIKEFGKIPKLHLLNVFPTYIIICICIYIYIYIYMYVYICICIYIY